MLDEENKFVKNGKEDEGVEITLYNILEFSKCLSSYLNSYLLSFSKYLSLMCLCVCVLCIG